MDGKTYAVRYEVAKAGKKTIYLHEVVMCRIINRPLRKNERVIHMNGNTMDNRRENLQLIELKAGEKSYR